MCVSLIDFHIPKRTVWAMLKKGEGKEKYPCQKAWEKKMNAKEHEEKKRKRKERNKDSPYFQIKGIHPKERDSSFNGVPKIFRNRTLWKIPRTCTSWSKCMTCISLRSDLWLSKICGSSMPQFHTYPKPHSKAISGRISKRRQNTKCLGEVSYTLSDRENHSRNLHLFYKKNS